MTRPRRGAGPAAVVLAALLVLLLPAPGVRAPSPPRTPGGPTLRASTAPFAGQADPASAASPSLNWTNLTGFVAGGPPPRFFAASAFDAASSLWLLFGGVAENGTPLNDTWSLGSAWNWTELSDALAPAARWGASLAYDAPMGELVLFGGINGSGHYFHDSWAFGPGGWSRLRPTVEPPGRAYGLLLPSPNGSGLILTGGLNLSGRENGTWYFQGGNWTDLTASLGAGPSPRWGASGSFLPGLDEDVVFGGNESNGSSPSGNGTLGRDTWTFNGARWSELALPAGELPEAREEASMAYDALDGVAVLFGGRLGAAGPASTAAYAFNGSGWSQLGTTNGGRPHARFGAAMVGVGPSLGDLALLFGGGVGNLTPGTISGAAAYRGLFALGSRAPLLVAAPLAAPAEVDPGLPLRINVSTVGGVPPFSYRWTGLPGPCNGTATATLACTATSNATATEYFRPQVTVHDSEGELVVSPNGSVVVNGPLRVASLVLTPSAVAVDGPVTVAVTVAGGQSPYAFRYLGLPPGCLSENLSSFSCTPSATGQYFVTVNVTDAFGLSANASTVLSVAAAGLPWARLVGGALAIAGVATIIAVVVLGIRRGRARRAAAAAPAPTTTAPSEGGATAPPGPGAGEGGRP